MAGGALRRSEAARDGRRLHAGVRIDRRPDGDRRLLPGRHLRRRRCPTVRGGHEAWRYTLMSGVIPAIPLILIRPFLPESPAWQREEARRHAQAPELRRALPAAVPPDDDRHDDHDGVRVRRRVRRHSADAAHRARPAGSARAGADARRSRRSAACSRSRSSAASPAASCSPSSPASSSAGAGCSACSRFPG